jgi:addiction module HigA family antidote
MSAATQPSAKRQEYPVRRPLKRPAVHPGVLMREILEDHLKLAIAESARRMGVSRPALYAVLNGSAAVTAEMALRFARLTGGAPELYLNMQTGYDLEAARQRLKETETALPASAVHSGRHFESSEVDLDPVIHRDEPPDTKRRVVRRKAAVITAVRAGRITLEEALQRYQLTEQEYRSWERNVVPPATASDHPPRAEAKGRRSRRR